MAHSSAQSAAKIMPTRLSPWPASGSAPDMRYDDQPQNPDGRRIDCVTDPARGQIAFFEEECDGAWLKLDADALVEVEQ